MQVEQSGNGVRVTLSDEELDAAVDQMEAAGDMLAAPAEPQQVAKAIGLGTGKARVLDPSAPNGFRDIRISRKVRIFTNGKGDLSITPEDLSSSNPATGLSLKNGDEVVVDIDRFVNLELEVQGGQIKVRKLTQVKPTTHVSTGPLDVTAIEKILNNPQVPQIPSEPGP